MGMIIFLIVVIAVIIADIKVNNPDAFDRIEE